MVELEQILTRLAESARETARADASRVCLLDGDGARLSVHAVCGAPDAPWPRDPVEVEKCPLDLAALAERLTVIADTAGDPRAVGVPGGYRSAACLSLSYQGTPVGTLHVYATAPQRFDEADLGPLAALADLGAVAIVAARTLAALKGLEASKARFIRVATHELRAPVTVAQSLVRGVLKGYAGDLNDKQADVLDRINRRLDFLESLINDLLDLAAGKAPELVEEEQPVLLNASVGRAVLLLQPRAEEKGLELALRQWRERLVVQGTEEGLDRIFVNLISNAVKYTPPGGKVTVTVQQTGGQARVEVADTGIGIPEEALPHLFEEFYRAPNAKALHEAGTGLGLSIVRDLVERFGGHIRVESAEGQGTRVAVVLPALGPG